MLWDFWLGSDLTCAVFLSLDSSRKKSFEGCFAPRISILRQHLPHQLKLLLNRVAVIRVIFGLCLYVRLWAPNIKYDLVSHPATVVGGSLDTRSNRLYSPFRLGSKYSSSSSALLRFCLWVVRLCNEGCVVQKFPTLRQNLPHFTKEWVLIPVYGHPTLKTPSCQIYLL